ncbi:MAG: hypothetical protein MMC33_007534 [Icmadophila ericetorum]|nr:hypothetical protein [Icmadophila ericetorum]
MARLCRLLRRQAVTTSMLRVTNLKGSEPLVPGLLQRRSKPAISDSESSSDDDGCSCTSKQSWWSDLDEQRLLAYKKADKSWDWIFGKFPGRTPAAVRTRWNMVRPRGE